MEGIQEFKGAMRAHGLTSPEIIEPGKLYRFPTNGKRGDDAGWCKLFADGVGRVFGDFRSGLSETWQAQREKPFTPAEREAFRQRCEAERQARDAEEARRHTEAASRAAALWQSAQPATDDHPYLDRKKVSAVASLREIHATAAAEILGYAPNSRGEPLTGRLLVVPVKVGDKLSSIEFIDEAGRKSALYSGAKAGGYWASQALLDGDGAGLTVLIGEGVATVLSAREATGYPAVAALSSGNLSSVAKAMRDRYPAAVLVILADLLKDTGLPDPHAIQAAASVGGVAVAPDFGPNRDPAWSDFNDMAVHRGLEAVAECIRGQVFQKYGVTGVTGVQPSRAAGSSRYTTEKSGVTGVTEPTEDPNQERDIPKESKRPCFRVFDEWVEHQTGKLRPGVWFFGVKQGRKAEDPAILTQQWVCSPLYIDAVTEDGQDNNFGRLLRFRNTLGRWREWAMPMELLRGLGDEMRGELLAMGVEIDPRSKTLLGQYLQSVHPRERVHCALQVGWCGDSFVLPDQVVGVGASGVIFQSGDRQNGEYTCAGTLAGWRSEVAARAPGNPLLVQTLSSSFTGPMLKLCNAEGGGLHFTGDSSIGKTAAIDAGCSAWGGANFRRSWKTTANGMEGAAAMSNDGLLSLDEISECDPREVGAIVYALANGYGKQRASRTGSARAVTRWRCFVLSSGERSVATHMAEGGRRAKAGQSVRLLDVPVSGKFGAWDDLHGLPTGAAFSDEIKRAAVAHHGHAGRAFLEKLTRDTRNFCERLERIKALPAFSVEGGEGQDKRAAARFALVALAGEVATEYGITGWEEGTAIEAAAEGFKAWRSLRGRGNDERLKILAAVSDFIDRHGDSRFSSVETVECYGRGGESLGPDPRIGAEAIIRDRAGWWQGDDEERVYLFNADGMREALRGFDFNRALDTLQEVGALPPADASGKRSTPQRIGGRLVRLYAIHPGKLEADHGA
jgi:putative DNA primase/helicase